MEEDKYERKREEGKITLRISEKKVVSNHTIKYLLKNQNDNCKSVYKYTWII